MKALKRMALAAAVIASIAAQAQEGPGGFDGPPPFGPPGMGPGFGPGMREDIELVKKYDKDNNGWLNKEERQEARGYMEQAGNRDQRRGPGGGGRRGFGPGGEAEPAKPGVKVSPAEVKSYGEEPLYASNVLRTIFLEFESADWEKELETFNNTDVDVPARLTVDGKSYPEVGVRFRGNTSFMFVPSGSKRPLNISMDLAHKDQNLLGFRTLNLLNGHEDPSFLHTVLALQMAQSYFPAPRANFVRLVVNGENWGVYQNVEQFNKDFLRDWFAASKGVRWKVPGSPGGRGGLDYLGDDVAAYRDIYELKSKDEPKAWASLIRLCKTLEETAPAELEAKLRDILDIDSVLRFFAWDNVLASGDGFWTRASDYSLYEDAKGRFHFIPYDVNETFSMGGGPGGRGGGPGGGFGPGMFLAPAMMDFGDKDKDGKLSSGEFSGMAETWFDEMDAEKKGMLTQEQLVDGLNAVFPGPGGPGGPGVPGAPGAGRGGRGRFGPGMFVGPAIFSGADINKDTQLTREEMTSLFGKWYSEWNTSGASSGLDEAAVRTGLNKSLPAPGFRAAGPGGPGQAGGRRGPGGPGFGGGPRGGPTLDPLVSANDSSKPALSKLLAVPELRNRYLGYVRDMAEVWLDWDKKLGPIAKQYHALINEQVKLDTKKLISYEAFAASLEGAAGTAGAERSLKAFADQRRAFLLNHAEVKAVKSSK